jgi:AAA+ ATPase superfamily predicted ATPase
MTTNPFTFGNPIRDPARFYGRKGDIRQIVNRLLSTAHESTSTVGERRIGKTSLLYHLSKPDVAASHGLNKDAYCLVYIDFQGLTDITPQRFWQRILHKMSRSICEPSLVPSIDELQKREDFDLFDLEDLFERINLSGLTVVLFMDEFEYVTQNPNFGADFFGGLRALAIHYDLALVTATRRELVDLCHSEEIKGSPFFNIFANVVLKPFTMAEVHELIDGYVKGKPFAFSPEENALALRLGGGHPFFVQIAGYYIVDGKMQGLRDEQLVAYVAAEFDQQADPHFEYYWSHCSESEKITLLVTLALSQQKPTKKTIPTLENLIQLHSRARLDIPPLQRRGLVVEADGKYSLLSQGLERWIAREITSTPEEQETQASVEAWLAGGGHESLQPVKGVLPTFKKKYWPVVGNILKEMSFEVMGAAAFELVIQALI